MGNFGFQELMLIGIILLVLVPGIFFLIELQKSLHTIGISYRKIAPGNVWLLLIPLFNLVYTFIVVNAIACGFQKQLEMYGVYSNEKPTYNLGLAWAICLIAGNIPMVGSVVSLAGLVLWIIYWIKVYATRKQLELLALSFNNEEPTSIFRDQSL